MWSTKQFGGLLVILLTAPVAGWADSTPAEALAELKRDLETISLDLTKSRQPRTTDVDQKAAVERYCLQAATLARRALALAEAHRDSPEAPEALAWILVGHLGDYTAKLDAECDSSYDLMAKRYLDRDAVLPVCQRAWLNASSTVHAESFLRAALERSTNPRVRAIACFGLGQHQQRLALQTRMLDDPAQGKKLESVLGPENLLRLRTLRTNDLRREAEALYERTINEFAAMRPIGDGSTTLGEEAGGMLFRLRNLDIGCTVPEIEVDDVDGKSMKLSDFRGSVVLISFWATWCAPCMTRVPDEKALVNRMKGRPFVLVGVNGDEDREKAKAVSKAVGINWRSFWNRGPYGPIALGWGVRGWPTTFVIDAKGIIRYDNPNALALQEAVDTLVAEAETAAAGAARARDGLPRYRLEPGMELRYKGSSTFRHQNGMHVDDQETTAWVVRHNSDGSVRVVLRQGNRFTATSAVDSLKSLFMKQDKPPMKYHLGYFDLFPDGRLGPDAELGYEITPASLFPRLPADEAQSKAVWGDHDEWMGQEYRYSSLRAEPGGWAFRAERVGPENRIYGMSSMDSTFQLDTARGAIRRFEQEFTQDYRLKGKGSGSMELTGVETHDATWLAAFASAADRYFAERKAYGRATEEASKDADKGDALLADAKTALQLARDAIEYPIFREQLDRQIANHDATAKYCADSAKRRSDVVGKPAADSELQGFDGKTHALAEYRGKVVVLDFWYRDCGWCIKAMPQLNALAERFEGRPVAVLGINEDLNEADAKFVADTMGLKYATLHIKDKDKGILEKYGVQAFPTLILIDPEGTVRDVHVGYSPTLRVDLAKAIESLLPPKR